MEPGNPAQGEVGSQGVRAAEEPGMSEHQAPGVVEESCAFGQMGYKETCFMFIEQGSRPPLPGTSLPLPRELWSPQLSLFPGSPASWPWLPVGGGNGDWGKDT